MGIVCIRSPDRLIGGLTCIRQNRAVRQYRRLHEALQLSLISPGTAP